MASQGVAYIPLDRAYLTAIWLETLFYGMNFVLFWSCIFTLTVKRRTPNVNKLLISVAATQFFFSSTHVSLGFDRLIEGFIILRDQPGGPGAYFGDVSVPVNVVKIAIHTINSVVGDSVVVWRCYLVWGKSWRMCSLPILLLVGSTAAGLAQTIAFARAKDDHNAFALVLEITNGFVFGLSLATNIVVTILISLRIWYITRQVKPISETGETPGVFKYWKVLSIIVESGMIYSAALIVEITLYFLNSNSFYIIYDPIAQLTGIVPTMILVLVGLGLTTHDMQTRRRDVIASLSTFQPAFPPQNSGSTWSRGPQLSAIARPVENTGRDTSGTESQEKKQESDFGLPAV